MDAENFDFTFDEDSNAPHSNSSRTQGDLAAIEQWLEHNYRLWELGLDLAEKARCYRREYAYIPFNKSGWFSPN